MQLLCDSGMPPRSESQCGRATKRKHAASAFAASRSFCNVDIMQLPRGSKYPILGFSALSYHLRHLEPESHVGYLDPPGYSARIG